MKTERRNKTGKTTSNLAKGNPYVSNDEDLDLLTDKGVYPYDYLLHFI